MQRRPRDTIILRGMTTALSNKTLVHCDRSSTEATQGRQGSAKLPAAVKNALRCPKCRSPLAVDENLSRCTGKSCSTVFPHVEGVPILIDDRTSLFSCNDFVARRNTTINHSRNRSLRRLDELLPKLSRNIRTKQNYDEFSRLLMECSARPVVLVIGGSILGSGMDRLIREYEIQFVETDVSFGPRTQLICDAHDLPFEDQTFDGVVLQAVLQYLVDPARCIVEVERVLRPGGLIYTEIAFMQQVVHGRYDFTRYTHLGLRRLMRGFVEEKSGPVCGPAMALAWSCQFFLLSLANSRWTRRAMHAVGRLTLFWLKYLDAFLIDKPGTYDAASGFFFMGRKSGELLSDHELITLYRGAQ